jgi:hypothetical protein
MRRVLFVISGFRHEIAENCAALGNYYYLLRNPEERSSQIFVLFKVRIVLSKEADSKTSTEST